MAAAAAGPPRATAAASAPAAAAAAAAAAPPAAAAAAAAAPPAYGPTPAVVLSDDTKLVLAGQAVVAGDKDDDLEELTCSICLHPAFAQPVITVCDHVFHRKCLRGALRGKRAPKCPICSKLLATVFGECLKETPRCVVRTLARTKVVCPQGCGGQVRFEELRMHIFAPSGCPNTTLLCRNDGCGEQFKRTVDHPAVCAHAEVPCDQCQASRKRTRMQEHLREDCLRRRLECTYCGVRDIVAADMYAHRTAVCTGPAMRWQVEALRERVSEQRAEIAHLVDFLQRRIGYEPRHPPAAAATRAPDVYLPTNVIKCVDGRDLINIYDSQLMMYHRIDSPQRVALRSVAARKELTWYEVQWGPDAGSRGWVKVLSTGGAAPVSDLDGLARAGATIAVAGAYSAPGAAEADGSASTLSSTEGWVEEGEELEEHGSGDEEVEEGEEQEEGEE
eukprot:TRINITY_DN51000_c0_g1_i1.p1 TRINITY_DN51000_c0_g1~~TRINITY_DN51000_c0_g1_i1.p1  ORF type:complete len:447 (+),score=162.15 TRINITY_DN51000_c0_g1_i1:62-1402(+)